MHLHQHNRQNGREYERPEKAVWRSMVSRCHNPKNKAYEYYGGKGVKVCESWRESFDDFIADVGDRPSGRYSIERINYSGDYEPSNCKWILLSEQQLNKSNNVRIDFNGQTKTLKEWCDELKLKYGTTWSRIFVQGLPLEVALTAPTIKTMCKNNHQFIGDNLYIDPMGRRVCRTCAKERTARFKMKRSLQV